MKKTLLTLVIGMTATVASANIQTISFDGDSDLYGLTRQSTNQAAQLEFVESFSFNEGEIEFSLTKGEGKGQGYALVNAGGTDTGLYISDLVETRITLRVPGGHITGARLCMTGPALFALDLTFNETEVSSTKEGTLYYWNWEDAEGGDTLSISWPLTYMARYLHSIEVTYTEDLGGKQECGLSFSESNVEAVLGEGFTPPVLENPNNLEISWSSSDENVATVDNFGKVTLIGKGKTNITVSTTGNNEYGAGNTRYTLTVIPFASNLVEMKEVAPEIGDRVKVGCPLTVTWPSTCFAFVTDPEGNAGYLEDLSTAGNTNHTVITIYKVGDVIAEGWIATNGTVYNSIKWDGLPTKTGETADVVYPEVTSVSPADVDRVVVLKDVTFTTRTCVANTKAYGTTPDGGRYEFQDTYDVGDMPAGTYDVTCIVRYAQRSSTVYFWLAPLKYTVPGSSVGTLEAEQIAPRYYNLLGKESTSPESGIYIKVTGSKVEKVNIR